MRRANYLSFNEINSWVDRVRSGACVRVDTLFWGRCVQVDTPLFTVRVSALKGHQKRAGADRGNCSDVSDQRLIRTIRFIGSIRTGHLLGTSGRAIAHAGA